MEELKTELALLKDAKRDEKKNLIQLNQQLATLTEELAKEKVRHFVLRGSFCFLDSIKSNLKQ